MRKNYFPTALLKIGKCFFFFFKCGALRPPFSTSLINAERFTSSFPFQIKLKMILLTSLTISLREQTKPALYIKTGITKDFIIWIRPKIVKFLQFQQFNLSFIVFRVSSKFNFLHRVWSYVKWTPKILIAFLAVMFLFLARDMTVSVVDFWSFP